ncbi:MAG: ATP-binding protein [Flavobacteriaceae bacterium]|nr:ATP-binding protein [Flavobacteriaceae bacterium]
MTDLSTVLKIGKVISVKGRQVKILVSKSKNTSYLNFNGDLIKNVSVGSYIKIHKGFQYIIGKIDGESIEEDKYIITKEYKKLKDKIQRILLISLLGYFEESGFRQGIKELPLIGNDCFLLTQDEFNRVHNFVRRINGVKDEEIIIGNLSSERSKEIKVGLNGLFASHIGIFGNTGSGKSYTLACLYHRLFKQYEKEDSFNKNAHFLFIDFNGEYAGDKCITEDKKVYNLSTRKEIESIIQEDKLPFSENALINIEIISILANATEKTQKPFISRSINFLKKVIKSNDPLGYFRQIVKKRVSDVMLMSDKVKAYVLVDYLNILVNKEDIQELVFNFAEWNNTNKHFMLKGGKYRQLTDDEIKRLPLFKAIDRYEFPEDMVSKVIDFLYLQLISDVHNDKAKNDHISPAIHKLKSKINDLKKVINTIGLKDKTNFCENSNHNGFDSNGTRLEVPTLFGNNSRVIVNLNDVNLDMKKTIPLLLSKIAYEKNKVEYRKGGKKYLNIVIDEAHNILSYTSQRESETWKDYRLETFEEIIKEGRKFGVFLTIASQRPSDISTTIISQLHNYFLHRLINDKDIDTVKRSISYLDRVSFEALPIMPIGTCILAGLSAQVPVVVEVDKIDDDYEPLNKTIRPTDYWK